MFKEFLISALAVNLVPFSEVQRFGYFPTVYLRVQLFVFVGK